MKKQKLLIATTNHGKLQEIASALADAPFNLLSLRDMAGTIEAPEETEETSEGNALIKARYYATRTGLLTLADDSGLAIDALAGWPGVQIARVASDSTERNKIILERMKSVPDGVRGATFSTVLALYDPNTKNSFLSRGETRGVITTSLSATAHGFGADPLFYLPEAQKTYAEMSLAEKNDFSHRGKALKQMEHILIHQYAGWHIVAPLAIIVKQGQVLMDLRHDPHHPEFHKKWEFPGGSMELGETLEDNVIRETKEETGFEIEVVTRLSQVEVVFREGAGYAYQVYLLPHVCRLIGGTARPAEQEVLETRWFALDDVLQYDLLGANADMYQKILPELKKLASTHQL